MKITIARPSSRNFLNQDVKALDKLLSRMRNQCREMMISPAPERFVAFSIPVALQALPYMRMRTSYLFFFFFIVNSLSAQNPLITTQYTADPSARVFGDRVYVYPSHDILATPGHGRVDWFCMEDYHVFSSADLTSWTDHGMLVTQNKVPWVKPDSYSMWAPDCVYRKGKYYFYFPSTPKDSTFGRGFAIGVAVSDKPTGPFVPQTEPIKGVHGIDPNVFIDKDGQAYLYWSQGNIYVAKLKENMLELASEPKVLDNLPAKGLKEGPYLFERNGIYYLTFPHVENKTERLEYSMGNSPLGPFKMTGVIMDESASGCWTNHHSVIRFRDQWYLFYHNDDLSPKFDKNRSVRMDSLSFNADGTIRKVVQTLRGVGVTDASKPIQLDRYSRISDKGASVNFIDTTDRFKGWKVVLESADASVQYNRVNFGNKAHQSVTAKVLSETGCMIQIRDKDANGPVIAEINVPKGTGWTLQKAKVTKQLPGIRDLCAVLKGEGKADIDWISFQ